MTKGYFVPSGYMGFVEIEEDDMKPYVFKKTKSVKQLNPFMLKAGDLIAKYKKLYCDSKRIRPTQNPGYYMLFESEEAYYDYIED